MTVLKDRPVLPPTDPAEHRELAELAELLAGSLRSATLLTPDGTVVRLPPAVFDVLAQAVDAMRAGRAITVASLSQRLTTQEAAELLGISRPTLVKLLEKGEIPFEQPGHHRRVRLDDLLAYQTRRRTERERALDELVRRSEELGLYEDDPAPEAGE
ncbi:helix-turn-helix domain-containing protein [Streptomyces sp. NPDC059637]|uniref:helix-turn-helix domain-containing protein n=1 Tax=Streptomyces sp. NPDC059637 TaxID=3347752 RepID=UPI0036AFF6A4